MRGTYVHTLRPTGLGLGGTTVQGLRTTLIRDPLLSEAREPQLVGLPALDG